MNSENFPLYIFGYIISFFLGIFITRAIFSIGPILRHLKAHTRLMAEIATAQGVDTALIRRIWSDAEGITNINDATVKNV